MAARLIRFQSDELEALQMRLQDRDLDARRMEALRRAQFKLDQPMKTFGKPKKQRAEDPEYRRWIKRQPCVICGTLKRIDPAHTGPHWMSLKSDDRTCVPLCREHHTEGPLSYHKQRPQERFEKLHGVDLAAEVARLNAEWDGR